jgi:hypothetical protein
VRVSGPPTNWKAWVNRLALLSLASGSIAHFM